MAKILVTGGAGFIGSNTVDLLIEKGHDLVVIDNLTTGKEKNLNPKGRFYKMDLQSSELNKIFKNEKIDFVCHLAAQINLRLSVKDPVFDAENNILASLNLLENCVKHKVKKIVFSSTGGALYGEAEVIPTPEDYEIHPISPYGAAKFSVENYLYYYHKIHNLKYTALRYANVYGPRQDPLGEAGVIAVFASKLLHDKQPMIFGSGEQTRDYVYVTDVCRANFMALENDKIGAYNVGTGVETSVNRLFDKLIEITDKDFEKKHSRSALGEQKRSALDYSKIKKEFSWQPKINIDKGLEMTVDWFRQNI
jgi:UDP-glucose 4-epimerase